MFRIQVVGISIVLLLGLGFWGAQLRNDDLLKHTEILAEREFSLATQLMPTMYRLDLEATRAKALEWAENQSLITQINTKVKSQIDYLQRHELVDATLKDFKLHEQEQSVHHPLSQAPLGDWTQGHPYFIFVTDANGVCIAHTNNPRCYAENEQGTEYTRMGDLFPSLKPLLDASSHRLESFVDVWIVDHKPMLVGAAVIKQKLPTKRGNRILEEKLGLMVVGYPLRALAEFYKNRLLLDFAFVRTGIITDSSSLDGDLEKQLQKRLTAQNAESKEVASSLKIRMGDLGSLPSVDQMAYVIAIDWDTRLKASQSSYELLWLALIAAVIVLLMITLAYAHFVEPFKQIDLGLIEVQNGNEDYWFSYNIKDNGLSKTIAQNLDVIVSRYLGRPEPEIEDEP